MTLTADRSTPGADRVPAPRPRSGRRLTALGLFWIVTRLTAVVGILLSGQNAWQEVAGYQHWADTMLTGTFPTADTTWQYPPGSALIMLLPYLSPLGTYVQIFILMTVVVDGLVTLALIRTGPATRPLAPAWIWTAGIPVLFGLPYTRYDIFPTACAVLALLLVHRRPTAAGVIAGTGISLKAWPALLLIAAPGRTWRSALAVAAGVCLTAAALLHNALGFLTSQAGRGVEYESVGGSLLLAARHLGYTGHIEKRYGSYEIVGPHVAAVADASLAASALAACWLIRWRRRTRGSAAPAADAALTATLLFVVTSRVISPQYLIWLLGLVAVCAASRTTTQRPVIVLVLACLPLTALEFPIFVNQALAGQAPVIAILLLRNLLLVTAALWSCHRLRTHPGPPSR
ncbi:DUF2029 domain-containing protein [Streptomyces roseirectus]|uniref:DUF2029 domain-containing protein n=1 Tax=Streptomyces roseirectus TaxID=2768066 RepID=A0A7H0IMV5_9ACTN|nr:glycosyltransferase family 87 protein [Streptomyces roseirectus]QNP74121.1 DUF2029 domain-containing protein [Streptomyces roseirectus]